jgi:transitional endoplasmic reticulum ATPase
LTKSGSSRDPFGDIERLKEAVAAVPDNLPLRSQLAEAYLAVSDYDAARAHYQEALNQGAGADAKLGLARVFYEQGMFTQARRALDQALVICESIAGDPQHGAKACLTIALILQERGEVEEARERYTEAVTRDPYLSDPKLADQLRVPDPELVRLGADGEPITADEGDWSPGTADAETLERPDVTFADIGGMEHVKDEIRMKIVHPLKQPELFAVYGKQAGGGLMLYGPPGCGKTHLARATAGEVEAGFIAVGIEEVLSMWLGESEQQLHEVFQRARRAAPCVLFFDEVDALGARRSDLRHGAMRQLVNQFLAELDGVKASNEGILVLAATNAPWHVDDALRRPGRFDRVIFVPPPDAPARAAILDLHLADKPQADLNLEELVGRSEGFSGADLRAIVERAVESKLRDSMKAAIPLPLQTGDLLAALKGTRPTTAEWMHTARSYALHANQAGTYDDVLAYLELKR